MKRTKKRFSNYDPNAYGPITEQEWLNGSGTTTTGSSSLGQNTSGSGAFDWGGLASSFINAASSVATSIWGNNNAWQANAYNTMYQQEKRTNTVLWVIIGLIVALGVFLVIRKTK